MASLFTMFLKLRQGRKASIQQVRYLALSAICTWFVLHATARCRAKFLPPQAQASSVSQSEHPPVLGKSESVPIWVPHDSNICHGTFTLRVPSQHGVGPVALVVREAAVDWRHVSIRDARESGVHGDYRRLIILMSVIPDPNNKMQTVITRSISNEIWQRAVTLHRENRELENTIEANFDYLLEDKRCERACKTYRTCRVREWQAIVTLLPIHGAEATNFAARLQDLSDAGAFLKLQVPVELRSTSAVEVLDINIGLACVATLSDKTSLPRMPYLPERKERCGDARGSVAISGGALFGQKRFNESAWREIAHYAARHLYGHTWYDTVAVALLPEYSLAEILKTCEQDSRNITCVADHHAANLQLMHNVRKVVESELETLNVPKQDWTRLLLFMFCRLGTDFEGSEAGAPCQASHHAGQKILGHIGYAVFAPYHRWASNFDIDEFLVDELAKAQSFTENERRLQSAVDRFNALQGETGKTSFYAVWKDFTVDPKDQVSFTQRVMFGRSIGFSGRELHDDAFDSRECYGGGGKVATSCWSSVSFMVHYAMSVRNGTSLSNAECVPSRKPKRRRMFRTSKNETELYTWHVRDPPRQGNCIYNPKLR